MADEPREGDEFQREAQERRTGLVREFWEFIAHNKKWWILPIVAVLLVVSVFAALSGSWISPWLYTLF